MSHHHVFVNELPSIIRCVFPGIDNNHVVYQDMDGSGEITIHVVSRDGNHKIMSRADIVNAFTPPPLPDRHHQQEESTIASIHTRLQNAFPEMVEWDPGVKNDVKRINIYGLVQSGKSSLILALIWKSRYILGHQPILVLANMIGSYHQMISRDIPRFNAVFCPNFPILVEGLAYIKSLPLGIRTSAKPLLVVMGNPCQLKRLYDHLEKIKGVHHLFVDEADQMVKHVNPSKDQAKTSRLFHNIQERCDGVTTITATPFALWNEDVAFPQKTIIKQPGPHYRALSDLEFIETPSCLGERNGSLYALSEFVKHVVAEHVRSQHLHHYPTRKYATILINTDSRQSQQDRLARILSLWSNHVFVVNSNVGVQPFQKGEMVHAPHGYSPHIGDLYNTFEKEDNDAFSIKIIVAGLKASRAVSFRPSDPDLGDGGINAMIYLPSKSSHMTQLIQAQRPFGNYSAGFPKQFLYSSKQVIEKLRAELTHNIPCMAEATRSQGNPRRQIEGLVMIDTRSKHDRSCVDDTVLVNKRNVHSTEYNRLSEILDLHLKPRSVIMTEAFRTISYPGFVYTPESRLQTIQRQHLKAREQAASLQVCWNPPRYEQLHDMKQRFGATMQYNTRIVCGDPFLPNENVPVVVWKAEFCRSGAEMRWRDDTAYIYQTTRNTWRVFTTTNQHQKSGVLRHSHLQNDGNNDDVMT